MDIYIYIYIYIYVYTQTHTVNYHWFSSNVYKSSFAAMGKQTRQKCFALWIFLTMCFTVTMGAKRALNFRCTSNRVNGVTSHKTAIVMGCTIAAWNCLLSFDYRNNSSSVRVALWYCTKTDCECESGQADDWGGELNIEGTCITLFRLNHQTECCSFCIWQPAGFLSSLGTEIYNLQSPCYFP